MDLHPDIERLALLGWRLHPASRRTRAACFADATALATHDLDRSTRWSREYPACGWRVVMEGSGIWALDVDVPSLRHKHDGVTALRKLIVGPRVITATPDHALRRRRVGTVLQASGRTNCRQERASCPWS